MRRLADVKATSRDDCKAESVDRIRKGISEGGMICMEVSDLCQSQQRPGPGLNKCTAPARCRGCEKSLFRRGSSSQPCSWHGASDCYKGTE